jgi:hypothetical protein
MNRAATTTIASIRGISINSAARAPIAGTTNSTRTVPSKKPALKTSTK